MISITIQGSDFADIQKKAELLFNRPDPRQLELTPEPVSEKVAEVLVEDITDVVVPKAAKEKRDRPSRRKPPEEPVIPSLTPVKTSKVEIHRVLQQVNVERGLATAREILASFGAQRISELTEENFDAFHAKCKDVLGN